jgi:hypothetical protein
MSETDPITGGCRCGAVRYEITGEPVATRACHCSDCQQSTGSAFSSNLVTREDDFRITQGETKSFDVQSDRGNTVERHFCPICGSPLYGRAGALPGLLTVRAGNLDDPTGFRPEALFYTSRAPAWLNPDDDIPTHAKMPDA